MGGEFESFALFPRRATDSGAQGAEGHSRAREGCRVGGGIGGALIGTGSLMPRGGSCGGEVREAKRGPFSRTIRSDFGAPDVAHEDCECLSLWSFHETKGRTHRQDWAKRPYLSALFLRRGLLINPDPGLCSISSILQAPCQLGSQWVRIRPRVLVSTSPNQIAGVSLGAGLQQCLALP